MKIKLIDRIRGAIRGFKDPVRPEVLYLCDGKQPECSGNCSTDCRCIYTADIAHAKNFKEVSSLDGLSIKTFYREVPSSVIPPVFSKKDLQFQTLYAQAWMDIPNLNDPSDEDKAIVKARAMIALVKSLEQYVLVQDDIDVNRHTHKVLVELKVVVPNV